jgi:hypothetical protein
MNGPPPALSARINVAFTLVCTGANGEVLKTIEVNGSVTPEQLGLTQEQLIKESSHDHNRQ